MDSSQEELFKKAVALHGKIEPTRSRKTLDECFTTEDSKLIFWFNDETGTTKVLIKQEPSKA